MSQFFEQNLIVLANRWPYLAQLIADANDHELQIELVQGLETTLLVNGIQLTSRHDRFRESQIQSEQISEQHEVVHLYGTAFGDLIQLLLGRSQLKELHVHLMNEALFKVLLHVASQTMWLSDPRVHLHLASEFKDLQFPFFALPSELLLASKQNAKLRDRVTAEVEVQYLNQRFKVDNPEFVARLKGNNRYIENDADVSVTYGCHQGRDAFIFASGPTLAVHLSRLKQISIQANRPVFIALDTAIRALHAADIQPDFVISVDKEIGPGHFPATFTPTTNLIYFPLVRADLLKYWQGKRYCAYSRSAVYDVVRRATPHSALFTSGSVIHPATDFAVKLGVKSITFFGADFGFPFNKTHSGWADDVLCAPRHSSNHWVLNGKNESIKTLLNFRGYLCSLERYIAAHREVRFYNASREGALIEGTLFHPEFVIESDANN